MHLRTESALVRVFDLLKDAPDIPVSDLIVTIASAILLLLEFEFVHCVYLLCTFIGCINIWYYAQYSTFDDWLSPKECLEEQRKWRRISKYETTYIDDNSPVVTGWYLLWTTFECKINGIQKGKNHRFISIYCRHAILFWKHSLISLEIIWKNGWRTRCEHWMDLIW